MSQTISEKFLSGSQFHAVVSLLVTNLICRFVHVGR